MQGAGSATHVNPEEVQTAVTLIAPVVAIMDFIYHATMVYLTVLFASVSALTGGHGVQNRLATESSETTDAKTAMPSSASAAVQAKQAKTNMHMDCSDCGHAFAPARVLLNAK